MENNEKEKIQEAEILESKNETENLEVPAGVSMDVSKKNKWLTDFYVELALFLILGILIGIALKTEAVKKITIGFDDYRMKIGTQDFDINKMQTDLVQKQKQEQEKENEDKKSK